MNHSNKESTVIFPNVYWLGIVFALREQSRAADAGEAKKAFLARIAHEIFVQTDLDPTKIEKEVVAAEGLKHESRN